MRLISNCENEVLPGVITEMEAWKEYYRVFESRKRIRGDVDPILEDWNRLLSEESDFSI